MQLGIGSWSVPWAIGVRGYPQPPQPLDALGLLDKAAEIGATVVQIADNLPLDKMPDIELERLRDGAAERGLTLEAGTRGLDPEHLARYAGIAQRIGARLLRTVLSGSLLGEERLAEAESGIRQALPALERSGVTLALENNEAFAASEFAGMVRRIGSPRLGICLDTANSLGRPETVETVVGYLAESAVMLHAKDYDIQRIDTRMGFSVTGAPVGAGRVDFDRVLSELRRHGRSDISVIVEHWPPFAGAIEQTVRMEEEWLQRSVAYLRARL